MKYSSFGMSKIAHHNQDEHQYAKNRRQKLVLKELDNPRDPRCPPPRRSLWIQPILRLRSYCGARASVAERVRNDPASFCGGFPQTNEGADGETEPKDR